MIKFDYRKSTYRNGTRHCQKVSKVFADQVYELDKLLYFDPTRKLFVNQTLSIFVPPARIVSLYQSADDFGVRSSVS